MVIDTDSFCFMADLLDCGKVICLSNTRCVWFIVGKPWFGLAGKQLLFSFLLKLWFEVENHVKM